MCLGSPIVLSLALSVQAAAPGVAAENPGGWRIPQRNGIFPAQGFLKRWPEGGPKLFWEAQVDGVWSIQPWGSRVLRRPVPSPKATA